MAFQFKIYEIHEEQDGDTLLLVASGEGNNKEEIEIAQTDQKREADKL